MTATCFYRSCPNSSPCHANLRRYAQDERVRTAVEAVGTAQDITIGNAHGGLFALLVAVLRKEFGSQAPDWSPA